jgi:hypothetical protein
LPHRPRGRVGQAMTIVTSPAIDADPSAARA